jgi:hypothetical protein
MDDPPNLQSLLGAIAAHPDSYLGSPDSYDVLERLPTHPADRIAELTPRAWKLARQQALASARA